MNVLFYVDKEALDEPMDSTMHIYNVAKEEFNTELCFTEDLDKTKDAHVVFNRFDIPWNEEFLREQYAKYNDGSRLFVNDPLSKINLQSKEYLLQFPQLTPTTIFSENIDELVAFVSAQEDVVFKPYDANQGKGIKHILVDDYSRSDLKKLVKQYVDTYQKVIAQDFIQGVEKLGDKRINVIDYEPVSAILRLPKEGSFLCNISAGGSANKTNITETDKRIVQQLEPYFRKHNVPWVGVDVIGPYLGEFNISSPGNLIEADVEDNSLAGQEAVMKMLRSYEKKL
ncbi:hypothetical protein K9M74_02890 [Candidatus Woesearchaeota archaeon]|nr:hypothetical protein [Candidatus Woesearchaeota archaeon]